MCDAQVLTPTRIKKALLVKVTNKLLFYLDLVAWLLSACLSLSLSCLLVISFPCMLSSVLVKYAQCAKQFKSFAKETKCTLCFNSDRLVNNKIQ